MLKRDSLSPATGALQRASSSESLNVHPLLSPKSPSTSMSVQPNQDSSTTTSPRYVPYTPRQRPPAPSATTSTTAHASIPVASHRSQDGGATSKLQLQNLKAITQGISLGSGTVGWAMLEKLVDAETGGEWDEIWAIITTAKPTLLLPLEPFSGELITPDLIKDHLAFCSGHTSSFSPLVTVSGLRGYIHDSVITFRSTVPMSSPQFTNLFKPESQTSALMSLPPLPSPHILAVDALLPSIAIPASVSLPIPPRSHHSKAPFPRPVAPSSTTSKPQVASRITIPFASLFGRPPASTNTSTSTPSSQNLSHIDEAQSVGIMDVAVFSLGKKIVKKSVGKDLSRVIKKEIKTALSGCPTWVIDRVLDFTGPLYPVSRTSKRIEVHKNSTTANTLPRLPSIISPPPESTDPSSLADAFQAFYSSIEDDLRAAALRAPSPVTKETEPRTDNRDDANVTEKESDADDKDHELEVKEEANNEAKIREILERVEDVVCTVFYDRTFSPPTGDDISHDDALANRIAALSLLDLSLEHLGVEIPYGTATSDVDHVVKSCGETLQALEDLQHRSPRAKSVLFIEAHKKLVDGLSRLPQLRLKPENDFENHDLEEKTPRASSFGKQAAKEVIHETASSSSLPARRQLSVGSEAAETALGDVSLRASDPKAMAEHPDIPSEDTSAVPMFESTRDSKGIHASEMSTVGSSPPKSLPPPRSPRSLSATLAAHPTSPTAISGDLLFPLLIFSVVKANPTHLVSHLLYTQRFRSRRVGGQESYCLINLMAVVEFLEHVDMSALGLGDSERVMSTADLTPIPLAHGSIDPSVSPPSPFASRLGKRMNQQVEELAGLAGSANRVITGVVDSSFGVLRGFLTSNPDVSTPHNDMHDAAAWNNGRSGFGLLRRGSGFSIASVAASLPGAGRPRTPARGAGEEGQQLLEVSSRPGSIREAELESEEDGDSTGSSIASSEEHLESEAVDKDDTRSVRSFSSMMDKESRDRARVDNNQRMSLTNRLANVSSLSRLGPGEQYAVKPSPPSSLPTSRPTSRPTSWVPQSNTITQTADPPPPHLNSSLAPGRMRIPPPNRRFLECTESDIRVGEVSELLHEYRRMVQALNAVGAFEDHV